MDTKNTQRERQELFYKAFLGLAGQGFNRSISEDMDMCLYRGENGMKCAVGHLIDDAVASDNEDSIVALSMLDAAGISREQISFLRDLQIAHDEGSTPELMEYSLLKTARDYDLAVPEIPSNG